MAKMFSLVLVLATLVTGIIWAMEKWVWSKKRQQKMAEVNAQTHGLDDNAKAKLMAQPWWIENSVSIFPIIAIVMIVRSFVFEPFQIPSGSMMPTLLIGDFIVVEKYAYGVKDPVWGKTLLDTGKPKRGDVAVFKYPLDPELDYIKRVVGLPGDIVRYDENKRICIQVKGSNECQFVGVADVHESQFMQDGLPLLQAKETLGSVKHDILINRMRQDPISRYQPRANVNEWIVPEGHYFMMGDNRDNSADSRFWGFVPEADLVGKAVGIWISFERERSEESILPAWIPSGVRFERIGGIN